VREASVSAAADGDEEARRGELRGASTTTNEASASAVAEKERVLNRMSGVGRKRIDAWVAGHVRTCGRGRWPCWSVQRFAPGSNVRHVALPL
jgi:hypothetical protein